MYYGHKTFIPLNQYLQLQFSLELVKLPVMRKFSIHMLRAFT